MSHPPLTRAPIPESVRAWRKEVAGIRRYLERIRNYRRHHGQRWVASQREYYKRRLDDLLDNAPPSMVKSGEGRQERD